MLFTLWVPLILQLIARTMWPNTRRGRAGAGAVAVGELVACSAGIAPYAALGRRAPNDTVELRFPLYVIFGRPVISPCVGAVLAAVDSFEDLPPPRTDRRHLAGNHVLLDCGGAWILLGHLQRGSLRVRAGERVGEAQPLGRVGNTGNSDEPHLHIHAQRPGPSDTPFGGDPLPLRFGDRYPVRNARFGGVQ